MKRSEIYLRAAKRLGESNESNHSPYCCDSIKIYTESNLSYAACAFQELFMPISSERDGTLGWWAEPAINKGTVTESTRQVQNYRRFALCLAAAIAESEGE